MKDKEILTPSSSGGDCLSTTESETSAAVVSVYQTWTGSTPSCDAGSDPSHRRLSNDTLESYTITTGVLPQLTSTTVSFSDRADGGWLEDDVSMWELDDVASLRDNLVCLRASLQKRLRDEQDIPDLPVLKKRRHPVCHFLNYMGTRGHVVDPPPLADANSPWQLTAELGLEENDALFPLSTKSDGDGTSRMAPPSCSVPFVTTKNTFASESSNDNQQQQQC